MFLYIHGFLSSSQSAKAQQFRHWLTVRGREHEWLCPDLPMNSNAAMQVLRECIHSATQPIKLVGSSLGGFYATVLSERFNLRAVVINPAVHPGALLKEKIGTHKAWHSDNDLLFTQDDVNALNAIDVSSIKCPDNFLLMVEKGDETLDYRQAIDFYCGCNRLVFNHGNHSFSRFEQVIDLIDKF